MLLVDKGSYCDTNLFRVRHVAFYLELSSSPIELSMGVEEGYCAGMYTYFAALVAVISLS